MLEILSLYSKSVPLLTRIWIVSICVAGVALLTLDRESGAGATTLNFAFRRQVPRLTSKVISWEWVVGT